MSAEMNSVEESISNSQKVRRGSKKSVRLCLMVAGQSGLGKSTFLHRLTQTSSINEKTTEITKFNVEFESTSGLKVIVDAIDTPGYDDENSAEKRAMETLQFLEKTFDEVFEEEQRIRRNPKFEDNRIHALIYFVEPTALGLKKFDVIFMKKICHRVNIIPVIAKSDSLTQAELERYQQQISQDITKHGVTVFDCASLLEEYEIEKSSCLPFAVFGREENTWNFVDIDNLSSVKGLSLLGNIIFHLIRDELREITEDSLYENYRTEKLISLSSTV